MRLHGYCTECRRFRLVRVTRWALSGVMGVCGECEDKPGGPPGVFDLRRKLGRAPTVEEFRATRGHRR